SPLPSIEPWLKAALERPLAVAARCRAPLEVLQKNFPLKEEPDAKKSKAEQDDDYNLADISEGTVTSLLHNKNTPYYIKCIAGIQAFREESVKLGNADLFNSYIQSLKRSVPSRGLQVFWDLLAHDAITLISQDEVEGSSVSKTEANQFLATEEKEEAAVAAVPAEEDAGDVDDLLDMM
ncbi:hypothetical protein CRUP_006992, partial [Coryphaenoides rupestris]